MLRSNSRPRLRLAAAGLALCGGLAAATPALAATGSPAGQLAVSGAKHGPSTLVVGDNGAVDTLNPYNGFTSLDFEVYGNIYDNLMDYGQLDYSGTPRLATSWSHTPDGLTWTYHIRKGVKWSDGVPLTAADVAYTFTRDIQPGSVEQADNSAYVGNITSAKATGPYTVVMKVSKPSPVMNRLIVFILPQHIWKHVSEKQVSSFQNTNPVGSGPFVVTSFHVNQSVTLKANPHYWGGKPGISGLVFQKYTNPSAEAIDLRNGRIGFAEDLTNALFKSLKDASGVTLNDAPSGNWDELAFNNGAATVAGKKIGNGNPALLDVNVRHAISYSLNLPELVSKVLLGYGSPGTSIIPPIYPQFHYTPPAATAYHFDPKKAEQILTADGWKMGPKGIRVKNGKQLELRLFLRSDSAQEVQAGQYIKGWLNAIGIGVSVTSMSDSTLTQDIGNGNYDMFIWGWGVEPNPDFQLSVFTCGQRSSGGPPNYTPGWSDSFYCDKTYDKLYAKQQTLDGPARAKVVKQMQQKLYADDPYSLLYYYDDTQAYRSDQFTGFAPQPNNPNGLLLFQEVSWWSYRCLRPVGTSPSLTDKNIGCAHEMGIAAANQQATSAGSGVSGAMIGGIAAAVVVLAAAGLLLARRRSVATADERE
ncbi:MAG TPA: ABC transporter substrate-binding protein [Streptosporangiaceae bacterium]